MSTLSSQQTNKTPPKTHTAQSMSSSAGNARVDAALDRLTKLWPERPYILSVPTFDLLDYSKAHYELSLEKSRFRAQFPQTDYSHQYLSNLYRESTDSCFEIRTEVDEERERQMKERQRKGMANGSATPVLTANAAKKKISLAAYKEKKEKGDVSVRKDEKPKPSLELNNANKISEAQTKPVVNGAGTKGSNATAGRDSDKKRKSPSLDFAVDSNDESPPSAKNKKKKQRTTPPPVVELDQGLPPMLSPILDDGFDLPPMLSPTLPDDLEEELRKRRERAASDVSSVASERKSSKIDTPSKPEKNAVMKEYVKAIVTASPEERKETSQGRPIKVESGSALIKPADQERPRKPRLLLGLKYGKRNRKAVERILRRPSNYENEFAAFEATALKARKSGKEGEEAEAKLRKQRGLLSDSKPSPISIKPPAIEIFQETTKKRPAGISVDHKPAKRARSDAKPNTLSSDDERVSSLDDTKLPSTPVQEESEHRKARSLLTPKDTSATSLVRSNSNRSHLSTPQNLTPLVPSRVPQSEGTSRPTTSSSSRAASLEMASWSKKYNDHGRKLKHEAQSIRLPPNTKASITAHKRKTVLTLESIMSYMIAYSFNDARLRMRGLPEDYQTSWSTLLPFLDHARLLTQEYPVLDSLRAQLGRVVNRRVHKSMMAHLEASLPNLVPGNSDGGTNAPSPDTPGPTTLELIQKIAATNLEGEVCMAYANHKYPVLDLVENFPETWEAQARGVQDVRGRENLLTTKGVMGPFWLPINEGTTPTQAVRFGIKLCNEWLVQQDLDHELSVANIEKSQ